MNRTLLGCTALFGLLACNEASDGELPPQADRAVEGVDAADSATRGPASSSPSSTKQGCGEFCLVDDVDALVAPSVRDGGSLEVLDGGARTPADGGDQPSDDGIVCEYKLRHVEPNVEDITQLEQPWLSVMTFNVSGAIEAAPDGSAWVIGNFGHELDLGAEKLRADAPISGFLHKVDRDCRPSRTQLLSATRQGDLIVPAALAVDRQGNAYVASVAGPLVAMNGWGTYPSQWATEFVIEKFSPSGASLYRNRIPTDGGWLSDMEVDAHGKVYVSGTAPFFTFLGSGLPLGVSPFQMHTFVVGLDDAGRYRTQWLDTGATMVEVAGEHVLGLTNTAPYSDALLGLLGSYPYSDGQTLYGRDAALKPLWQAASAYDRWLINIEGLANGGAAGVYTKTEPEGEAKERQSLVVRRIGPDGIFERETAIAEQTAAAKDRSQPVWGSHELTDTFFSFIRETPQHGLAMSALFFTPVDFHGVHITPADPGTPIEIGGYLVPNITPGVAVLMLDQDDHVLWARPQNWGQNTAVLGLSPAPNGDVFVAGIATVFGTPSDARAQPADLVLRKLRAD